MKATAAHVPLLYMAFLLACGSDPDANLSAELGWSFDHTAYTEQDATSDVRGCSNEPTNNPGPPYDAVHTVRVRFEDPEGQSSSYDQALDCERGDAGKQSVIRGLASIFYDLTLEAQTQSGQVLYRYVEEGVDLSSGVLRADYVLRTLTGELKASVAYGSPGSADFLCNAEVETLRASVFLKDEGGIDVANPAVTLKTAECDDGFPSDLYIRNIPSAPELTATGGWSPPVYTLRVEALDGSGNVAHCGQADRGVKPGSFEVNTSGVVFLSPGACGS